MPLWQSIQVSPLLSSPCPCSRGSWPGAWAGTGLARGAARRSSHRPRWPKASGDGGGAPSRNQHSAVTALYQPAVFSASFNRMRRDRPVDDAQHLAHDLRGARHRAEQTGRINQFRVNNRAYLVSMCRFYLQLHLEKPRGTGFTELQSTDPVDKSVSSQQPRLLG